MNAITQLIDAGYHAIATLDKEIKRVAPVRDASSMCAAQKRLHRALTHFLDDIFVSTEIEPDIDPEADAQDDADAHDLKETVRIY